MSIKEKFEVWARSQGMHMAHLQGSNDYDSYKTQGAWLAWQAAQPAASAEPFMYAIMGPDGKPHWDEFCVSGSKGDMAEGIAFLNDHFGGPFREVALYLSAPVAAQPSVPQYTSSIGHAGQAYLDSFKDARPLPAQFRWADLWMDMCKAAAPTPPAASEHHDIHDHGAFRLLVAACNRLAAEAEEYELDDGMGRAATLDYWHGFDEALEAAQNKLSTTTPPADGQAQHDTSIANDAAKIVELLDGGDWAEHIARTDLGHRLEAHVTKLIDQQDADKTDATLINEGTKPDPAMAGDDREAFEEWHRNKFRTKHDSGHPTRDMHNGVYDDGYGPSHQQQMWEAWKASSKRVQPASVDNIRKAQQERQP